MSQLPATLEAMQTRYLLAPELRNYPFGTIMLVAKHQEGDGSIELMLIAPGLEDAAALVAKLYEWLAVSLPPISEHWRTGVSLVQRLEDRELVIVVAYTDPRSVSDVLSMARIFLERRTFAGTYRIVTLGPGERFVPLDFQVSEGTPTSILVTLPGGIALRPPRLVVIEHPLGDDKYAALKSFSLDLRNELEQCPEVEECVVARQADGLVCVSVRLRADSGDISTQQLNKVEAAIAQIVGRHADSSSAEGTITTDLVFGPAYPHH